MRTKCEIDGKSGRKTLKRLTLDKHSKKNSAKNRKMAMKSSANFENGET